MLKSTFPKQDAVRQALAVIENHNGVILADVVGVGKTIIACAAVSIKVLDHIIIGDNRYFSFREHALAS